MIKKGIIFALAVAMVLSMGSFAYADDSISTDNQSQITSETSGDVDINNSRETKIYKEKSPMSGTEYNGNKKCVWNTKVFAVYKKNVGTEKETYLYKEYRWSWKGYKKENGKWKYVTSKSGITRTNKSGSDPFNFLTGLWGF